VAFLNSDDGHIGVLPDGRNVFRTVEAQSLGSSIDNRPGHPPDRIRVFQGVTRICLTGNHQLALHLFLNRRHSSYSLVLSILNNLNVNICQSHMY
jgi:hypothetical protein